MAANFEPSLAEYLVMTTASRDAVLKGHVRSESWPFRVELRFWEDISLDLSGYTDLVQKHFPTWTVATVGADDVLARVLDAGPADFIYNDQTGVLLCRADVRLRIVLDRDPHNELSFEEPWVLRCPNHSAKRQIVYVEYGDARILTAYFVWTDGARYLLPYPKSATDLRISRSQYLLGSLVASTTAGYGLDDGLHRAGIVVDATLADLSASG